MRSPVVLIHEIIVDGAGHHLRARRRARPTSTRSRSASRRIRERGPGGAPTGTRAPGGRRSAASSIERFAIRGAKVTMTNDRAQGAGRHLRPARHRAERTSARARAASPRARRHRSSSTTVITRIAQKVLTNIDLLAQGRRRGRDRRAEGPDPLDESRGDETRGCGICDWEYRLEASFWTMNRLDASRDRDSSRCSWASRSRASATSTAASTTPTSGGAAQTESGWGVNFIEQGTHDLRDALRVRLRPDAALVRRDDGAHGRRRSFTGAHVLDHRPVLRRRNFDPSTA